MEWQMEEELRQQGFGLIAGVDEAGRGPWAGPVAAGACVLPAGFDVRGLNDSKKLSEKKRKYYYEKITAEAVVWSVAMVGEREIDETNILQAAKLAMRMAIQGLSLVPDYVLIDGRDSLKITCPQRSIIGGDRLCASIAAASVLAKVARDRYMLDLHEKYPQYGFDRHKGYGTKIHAEALERYGVCPAHRRSFKPVAKAEKRVS